MRRVLRLAIGFWLLAIGSVAAQQVIDLSGAWDFAVGDSTSYNDYVMLPGSMLTNDKGRPVDLETQWTGSLYDSSYYFNPDMAVYRQAGNMKFPFFLTPKKHYVGSAWYRRSVYLPKDWKGERIFLFLERPHIETTVFVNGKEVGHQMSLSTPHQYDVTKYLKAGQRNTIAIKVYNGIENVCVGQDSHSVTDQTQGNWNGIVGRMELQARPKKVNIRQVRIYPDLTQQKARVVVDVENNANRYLAEWHLMQITEYGVVCEIREIGKQGERLISTSPFFELDGRSHIELDMKADDLKPWNEFAPNLYRLTVYAGDDVYETTFGMRDIKVQGRQLILNGVPLFLRGTVENCCFPLTGYPPTDEEEWLRIFRKCKDYGINHVRFHSYCPPEAAFNAADIMGIYLQPEGPSWPNHGVKLRRGMAIDQYLLDESKRIIDTYGNHPSFLMMASGNEPAGDWVSYTNDWVKEMHQYDSTKIYCGASVGGGWAWDNGSEYHVKGGARGLNWDKKAPSSDDDYYSGIEFPRNFKPTETNHTSQLSTLNSQLKNTSPIIAHEQGQWCAFPDLKETEQYTGVYKAENFDIFRDLLAKNGMASQAENFLMASGKLQTLCYKYEIERNLRTKDYAGFQLLGLNDYSGQGTALVGALNVFWREKGYVNARQWREFCSPFVVLARFPKFVYTNNETLEVPLEMMNAYVKNVDSVSVSYQLFTDEGVLIALDTLSVPSLKVGKNNALGTVRQPLNSLTVPTKVTLAVNFANLFGNHWEFWVYPDSVDGQVEQLDEKDLYIADSLDSKALKVLADGGKVLLTAAGKVTLGSDVKQSYLPVFWNTSWFKMRPPHTTGAYIDKKHPLFKYDFPTDSWSNINWWELLNKAQVMNLMELPLDYQSPIQPIDTWHISRKLGMLVEAKVLNGKLLMTTMDITSRLDQRVVARQMRQAILRYMQSEDFNPSITLSPEVITDFFTRQAPPVNMFTKDSPDELKPKLK